MTTLGPDEAAPLLYREVEELRRVLADTKAERDAQLKLTEHRCPVGVHVAWWTEGLFSYCPWCRESDNAKELVAELAAAEAELEQLRAERDEALDDARRHRLEVVERGRIMNANLARAHAAEAALVAARTRLTLAEMQRTQPWTAPYSETFYSDSATETHRWLMHDLMHVTKAVGILASIAEWADHGNVRLERVDQAEYEGRISDLVMCALHMANNPPNGYSAFDLESAVVSRVDRVNNTDWRAGASTPSTPEDSAPYLLGVIRAIEDELCTDKQAVWKVAYAQQVIIDAGLSALVVPTPSTEETKP